MNILGLKITGHDVGAAIIAGERVVAIAEERLGRIKHASNMFPKLSIDYCLKIMGLKPSDIEMVVIDQIYSRKQVKMKELFVVNTQKAFSGSSIHVINHHDAHAASAFFCSPFDEAAILVYDGAGEAFETHLGVIATETESLYRGQGNCFHLIGKTCHVRDGDHYPHAFGIGKLYSYLSQDYLSFGPYNEGKMMGLAPYGTDSVLKRFPENNWWRQENGHILCNPHITYAKKSLIERVKQAWREKRFIKTLLNILGLKTRSLLRRYLGLLQGSGRKSRVFIEPNFFPTIALPRPPRQESDRLPDDYYSSVAYTGQKVLESVATQWGIKLKQITHSSNITIAGGVGLNIDANMLFLKKANFQHIFIQPASSDTGIALGCALYGLHMIAGQPRFWTMRSADLGKKYTEEEILAAIKNRKQGIEYKKSTNIAHETAHLIAEGKIIGWFLGGAEYGPRALGQRSILCDTRDAKMKDHLNIRVKHREAWRPFAASVLKEEMSRWFEIEEESPFMLLAASVRPEKRSQIPAVVHVDGTCRLQSLTKEDNKRYYDLVFEYFRLTGIPLILNTSFNLAGDPIVETPQEAIDCFLSTGIDFLVLEDYLLSKTNIAA